jgi:hypothetical protein
MANGIPNPRPRFRPKSLEIFEELVEFKVIVVVGIVVVGKKREEVEVTFLLPATCKTQSPAYIGQISTFDFLFPEHVQPSLSAKHARLHWLLVQFVLAVPELTVWLDLSFVSTFVGAVQVISSQHIQEKSGIVLGPISKESFITSRLGQSPVVELVAELFPKIPPQMLLSRLFAKGYQLFMMQNIDCPILIHEPSS